MGTFFFFFFFDGPYTYRLVNSKLNTKHKSIMPKAPSSRARQRQKPLEDDILSAGLLRNKAGKRRSRSDKEGVAADYVDSRASRTILQIGRELEAEDQALEQEATAASKRLTGFSLDSRAGFGPQGNSLYKNGDEDDQDDGAEEWEDEDGDVEEVDVDPNDLETYRKFLPGDEDDPLLAHGWTQKPPPEAAGSDNGGINSNGGDGGGTNLADLILQKIAEFERNGGAAKPQDAMDDEASELPPKVVEVYTQ